MFTILNYNKMLSFNISLYMYWYIKQLHSAQGSVWKWAL